MSAITDIYDFETAIEEAFRAAIAGEGINAFTLLTVPDETDTEAAQQFQNTRPRVVIHLVTGAAKGLLLPAAGVRASSGSLREQAYGGTLTIELVTEAAIVTHRTQRAQLRALLDTICPTLNVLPAKHNIQRVRAAGTGETMQASQGAYVSRLTYDIDFSVQTTAWADLET